jgi:hypothetical protein
MEAIEQVHKDIGYWHLQNSKYHSFYKEWLYFGQFREN